MSIPRTVGSFTRALSQSLADDDFSHLALNHYTGAEPALKKIIMRKIVIKNQDHLSFTYRYQTRDIVKNYGVDEGLAMINAFLHDEWNHAILYTLKNDLIFQRQGKKIIHLNKAPPSTKVKPAPTHDKQKKRLIEASSASYLTALNLADKNGKIYQNAQDKYRQINKFIEIFTALQKDVSLNDKISVLDMGSGKGYLTFALYDYLQKSSLRPFVTGIEYRQDMVDFCNDVAKEIGFENLNFIQSTITDYSVPEIDVLIALHACDTATDEAIASGIKSGAKIILCSPCCHKQIRRELDKNKPQNALNFMTDYGTFMERHAEMLTDGLRALILEYYGYKTNIFEFISSAHTPKNIKITAVKSDISEAQQTKTLADIRQAKNYFGITQHHLEKLMNLPQ